MLASCGGTPSQPRSATLDVITTHGYASLKWGDPIAEAERRFKASMDCRGGDRIGCPCPAFHPAIAAELVFGPMGLSEVHSGPRTVTPEGVHQGSTLADARRAYPQGRLVLGPGNDAELPDHLLVQDGKRALAFGLTKQRVSYIIAAADARRLGGEPCA